VRLGLVTYQEGVVDVGENGVLRDNVVNLPELDDIGLLQTFHGEVLSSLLVLGEQYTTKRT